MQFINVNYITHTVLSMSLSWSPYLLHGFAVSFLFQRLNCFSRELVGSSFHVLDRILVSICDDKLVFERMNGGPNSKVSRGIEVRVVCRASRLCHSCTLQELASQYTSIPIGAKNTYPYGRGLMYIRLLRSDMTIFSVLWWVLTFVEAHRWLPSHQQGGSLWWTFCSCPQVV